MKVKFNIDKNFKEERAEFWLHKMTNKINSIAQELNNENDFVWCYRRGDMFPVKFSKIDLIQVENEKTYVYTEENVYAIDIKCNDVEFPICINQKDLIGEPAVDLIIWRF